MSYDAAYPVQNINSVFETPNDKFGCSMMMLGSTRSGKTTLLNYIFKTYFKGNDYINTLMSNSLNSDAYDYIKKYCVCSDFFHPEVLLDMYKINHATKNHYKFNVICDDLPSERNQKELMRLLTIYRNSRMTACICIQAPTLLPPVARNNINYVFCGRLNSDFEIERTIKNFIGSYFPRGLKMEDKIRMYREMTNNHEFFLINNIDGTFHRIKLQQSQLIGT
jgi:hypothetical protein